MKIPNINDILNIGLANSADWSIEFATYDGSNNVLQALATKVVEDTLSIAEETFKIGAYTYSFPVSAKAIGLNINFVESSSMKVFRYLNNWIDSIIDDYGRVAEVDKIARWVKIRHYATNTDERYPEVEDVARNYRMYPHGQIQLTGTPQDGVYSYDVNFRVVQRIDIA